MQSTQEIVELILDSNRNALLGLDLKVCSASSTTHGGRGLTCLLKVSIGTMGIGMGALVAGLFGMNVRTLHRLLLSGRFQRSHIAVILVVDKSPRRNRVRVRRSILPLRRNRRARRLGRPPAVRIHTVVSPPFLLSNGYGVCNRLAKIRKVGLSRSANQRSGRLPGLPTPLRSQRDAWGDR